MRKNFFDEKLQSWFDNYLVDKHIENCDEYKPVMEIDKEGKSSTIIVFIPKEMQKTTDINEHINVYNHYFMLLENCKNPIKFAIYTHYEKKELKKMIAIFDKIDQELDKSKFDEEIK